ncbi:methylmalonyl-CoA mutase family protein [Caryophanon tenue]|uniref:Methylmalonyl-CoA mutase n=1 Tax=Caryophanon tenue TaxID=33978 RepID=A0A1C0YN80_9BACL|nr:methylmalonyl-CoA mutase family protein [Caryophanon tenue]OCS88635.1 methylmalonyl-CoA mutase [Caryophanon tenue]
MANTMKNIEFNAASYSEWQDAAVKALKGKPFESLFTKTAEGITLEPLYTQQMLIDRLGEQLEKQVATVRANKFSNDFTVAQQVYGDTAESFIENLKDSLARGNEALTIDSRVNFIWDEAVLVQIADYLTEYSFKLIVQGQDDALLKAFDYIADDKASQVEGFIISTETVTLSKFGKVRTYCANAVTVHNAGATAVQELAYVLASAAKYANEEQDFDTFASKFFVNFAIDTQFFMEVAKVRAMKVLWQAFTAAYGANGAVPVVAETSVRSFSKYDVYVNLLRAGNEALSGAIGGVDFFTVHPHDVLSKPTEQSIRIARNVQLVLKEETHVLKVQDPAGGSYFVEDLTAALVKDAWAYFLQIEEAGGLDAFAAQFDADVQAAYEARVKATQSRKQSLIGTNIYANPQDEVAQEENGQFADVQRIAIPFETLRAEAVASNVKAAVVSFGELKKVKPRADFVSGILNTVGIVPEKTAPFATVQEVQAYLSQTDASYIIIAATDDDVKEHIAAILTAKKDGQVVDVAGRFKEDEAAFAQAGVDGYVFAGQNIIEKVQGVLATTKEVQR